MKQSEEGNLIPVEDDGERESIQISTGSKRRPGGGGMPLDRRQSQKFDVSLIKDPDSSFMADDDDG